MAQPQMQMSRADATLVERADTQTVYRAKPVAGADLKAIRESIIKRSSKAIAYLAKR